MDRNSSLAFVLIALVVGGYMFYTSSITKAPVENKQKIEKTNTVAPAKDAALQTANTAQLSDSSVIDARYGKFFSKPEFFTPERLVTIETELYKAQFSSMGAVLRKFELKNFKSWNGYQTQLINDKKGEMNLSFVTNDGKNIDTRELNFDLNWKIDKIELKGKDTATLVATLKIAENKSITKIFKFNATEYTFSQDIQLVNLEDVLTQRGYNLTWNKGLRYQEQNSVDESSDSKALVIVGGEESTFKADEDKGKDEKISGNINYSAIHTKYFLSAIIPTNFDGTVDLHGDKIHVRDNGLIEQYSMNYRVPYKGGVQVNSFKTYLGPLDYKIVSNYGLERTVNFGWWIIRYIGEYFMMPIFNFLHKFIANYGITIIIFSLFMKLILYPFTISQMKSVQKMKLLAPEMEKIRTKHKDDQAAEQRAMMTLYGEYGVNPMGGCLPLLLQMPILYSLWAVLRTNIELRQSSFGLWITDLSAPDTIIHFGTSILGISSISGLSLLMGITMYLQQKMSVTDPRQKAMIYMMPVMFTFLFSTFPAGLNLYYFMFNVWSIAHQYYMNNFSQSNLTLEQMKAAPKKEGWLQQKMREAQMMAEEQGRVPKGTFSNDSKKDTNTNTNRLRKKK